MRYIINLTKTNSQDILTPVRTVVTSVQNLVPLAVMEKMNAQFSRAKWEDAPGILIILARTVARELIDAVSGTLYEDAEVLIAPGPFSEHLGDALRDQGFKTLQLRPASVE